MALLTLELAGLAWHVMRTMRRRLAAIADLTATGRRRRATCMTATSMEKLAGRRDLLLSLARGLLIATTLVWLGMMAFYDQSVDTMANPSILLSTETAYLLPLGGIGAIDRSGYGAAHRPCSACKP